MACNAGLLGVQLESDYSEQSRIDVYFRSNERPETGPIRGILFADGEIHREIGYSSDKVQFDGEGVQRNLRV